MQQARDTTQVADGLIETNVAKMQRQIDQLNHLLRTQNASHGRDAERGRHEILKGRQDQLLQTLTDQAKLTRCQDKLMRANSLIHTLSKANDKLKDNNATLRMGSKNQLLEIDRLGAALKRTQEERLEDVQPYVDETILLRSDLAAVQDLVDRNETLYMQAQDDLASLRTIEGEARSIEKRKRERQTLPPAYGGLDDDERIDPNNAFQEAVDSGLLEIATFKRTIRATFMDVVDQAVGTNLALRSARPEMPLIHQRDLDAAMFTCIISVTADACGNIKEVLMCSKDVSTLRNGHREIRAVPDKVSYVADRCTKLLLDLVSRLVAALDCRPSMVIDLCKGEFAEPQLAWHELDETMHKALAMALNAGGTAQSTVQRLIDLQQFESQITALPMGMHVVCAAIMENAQLTGQCAGQQQCNFFKRTSGWIEEQIEKLKTTVLEDVVGKEVSSRRFSRVAAPDVFKTMVNRQMAARLSVQPQYHDNSSEPSPAPLDDEEDAFEF